MSTEAKDKFKLLQCSVEEIMPALENADKYGYRLTGMTQKDYTYTLIFELKLIEVSSVIEE